MSCNSDVIDLTLEDSSSETTSASAGSVSTSSGTQDGSCALRQQNHVTTSPIPPRTFPVSSNPSNKHRRPLPGRVVEPHNPAMRSHTPSGDPPSARRSLSGRFRASSGSALPRPNASFRESRVRRLQAPNTAPGFHSIVAKSEEKQSLAHSR